MTPAGLVRVARDAVPLVVRVELDDAAAAALGWPAALAVERTGDVLDVTPAAEGRPTWRPKGGGLAVTVRVSLPAAMLGRWPAMLDAGALVVDTTGPDLGRRAA